MKVFHFEQNLIMQSLYFFTVFGILTLRYIVQAEICKPINGESVDCISISNCPAALTALKTKPLLPPVADSLRQIQCGFKGHTPQVCCPSSLEINKTPDSGEFRPTRPTRPPRTTETPVESSTSEEVSTGFLPAYDTCGKIENADRIYNGHITDIDEFPWMALLGYKRSNGTRTFECGGVLISKRYVLTAAHCVVGEINKVVGPLTTVRLGEYNTNTNPDCVIIDTERDCAEPHQDLNVEQIISHPGFVDGDVNRKDDIALLRLSRDVTFSYFINPICLTNSSLRTDTGGSLTVAGWGRTLNEKKSDIKLKLPVPKFDKAECIRLYSTAGASITDNQICAGGEFAEDTCNGDSGGPLMKQVGDRWYSVGVVSFGNGCGRDGWPGIYTSVEKYTSWIKQNLRA